jgi:hypothetical protein
MNMKTGNILLGSSLSFIFTIAVTGQDYPYMPPNLISADPQMMLTWQSISEYFLFFGSILQ